LGDSRFVEHFRRDHLGYSRVFDRFNDNILAQNLFENFLRTRSIFITFKSGLKAWQPKSTFYSFIVAVPALINTSAAKLWICINTGPILHQVLCFSYIMPQILNYSRLRTVPKARSRNCL